MAVGKGLPSPSLLYFFYRRKYYGYYQTKCGVSTISIGEPVKSENTIPISLLS